MKVSKEMYNRWVKYCELFCRENNTSTEKINNSITAWNIAFRLDIPKEAYHVGLNDAHILTALKRIFPKANVKI